MEKTSFIDKIRNFFILVLLGGTVIYFGIQLLPDKSLTAKEFRERIEKLEKKVDTIDLKIDTINTTTKRIDKAAIKNEKNIDSLKKGQTVIFKEVTKGSRSFIDKIKDLF
jgi:hypothetical protein